MFTDPKSGLTVVNKIPTKIDANIVAGSTQVNEALRGGHLVEIQEEEFDQLTSKEARKAAESQPVIPPAGNEPPPGDEDEDEDEDEDNEDEEDIEDFTKAELIDKIKANPSVP